MHLLLIRHGESVDNVAGLYAGSRDSSLTNHGVLQTRRLGAHLAARHDVIGPVVNIFTSNLQRAYRTAQAVADAQPAADLEVAQLPELREKDFGSAEGVKYGVSAAGRADGTIASDSETREAMMVRVNRFIDEHLESALKTHAPEKVSVVIVAHGIILNVLLQALTVRYPARADLASSLDGTRHGASWSNTGVLQAKIQSTPGVSNKGASVQSAVSSGSQTTIAGDKRLAMVIQCTNSTDHLDGLKKTKGGIGSARFDARQRPLTAFFSPTTRKRKAEDDAR